jgi:hypothetical protein
MTGILLHNHVLSNLRVYNLRTLVETFLPKMRSSGLRLERGAISRLVHWKALILQTRQRGIRLNFEGEISTLFLLQWLNLLTLAEVQ